MAKKPLPQYTCHKVVSALKIAAIKGNIIVPENTEYLPFTMLKTWFNKHNPHVGGYYIEYVDGYKSFSPAGAFERGYTLNAPIEDMVKLPDGSGCFTASMALPEHHWLYAKYENIPPMGLRMGLGDTRSKMAAKIYAAAQYAIRCATMNGTATNFDPDAIVQSLIVGTLGYYTEDGTTGEDFGNPNPLPPRLD